MVLKYLSFNFSYEILLSPSSSAGAWISLDAKNRKKTRAAARYGICFIADEVANHGLVSSTFYTNSNKRGFVLVSDICVT